MAAAAAEGREETRSKPKLVGHTFDCAFHLTLACDLEFDLTARKLLRSFPLPDVTLRGKWYCQLQAEEDDGETYVCVSLGHNDLLVGCLGGQVKVDWEVYATDPRGQWLLCKGGWDAEPMPGSDPETSVAYSGFDAPIRAAHIDRAKKASGGAYHPATHRSYRIEFNLRQAASTTTTEAKELAERIPKLNLSPVPYDVRLYFPNACNDSAELWKRPRTRASGQITTPDAADQDLHDSDNETDELYFKQSPPSCHVHEGDCGLEYKQIVITKSAFTTYRAVLAFLRTGNIAFAPLTSAYQPLNPSSNFTRAARLSELAKKEPIFPVSPKSAFRLAHLLDLDRLQQLCLANLRKSLAIDTVAHELFHEASVCFDAWRDAIIGFVVENWDAVMATDCWKDTYARLERDEIPGATLFLLKLMEKKPAGAKA
ncbi:hypothetical protein JCM10296v2_007506 [Rhodotorula toruloides]